MSPPDPLDPQSPSPSPSSEGNANPAGEAASSKGSSTASATSAAAFIGDPGPAFDAEGAADLPAPEPAAAQLSPDVEWEEATIRNLLTAKGEVLHTAIAVDKDSDEWRYTTGDLHAIAPPLTRILNRYDATRAAAATGDELALIIGLVGYAGRSIAERRVAIAAHQEHEAPAPITGMTAEGVTPVTPESEHTWQVDG